MYREPNSLKFTFFPLFKPNQIHTPSKDPSSYFSLCNTTQVQVSKDGSLLDILYFEERCLLGYSAYIQRWQIGGSLNLLIEFLYQDKFPFLSHTGWHVWARLYLPFLFCYILLPSTADLKKKWKVTFGDRQIIHYIMSCSQEDSATLLGKRINSVPK